MRCWPAVTARRLLVIAVHRVLHRMHNMLRLASKRVALPSRRAIVRLQSTKPPLPPPATTPLPPPETTALPPPGATAPVPPPPPAQPAPPAEPLVTPVPATEAPELAKVEVPKVELPKPAPEVPSPAPAVHHAAVAGKGAASRLKSLLVSSLLFLGTGALLVYAYDSRAGIHRCVDSALHGVPLRTHAD